MTILGLSAGHTDRHSVVIAFGAEIIHNLFYNDGTHNYYVRLHISSVRDDYLHVEGWDFDSTEKLKERFTKYTEEKNDDYNWVDPGPLLEHLVSGTY
jgi:hypothetical protein